MTTPSLRFLCAGGFQLHEVLEGTWDVPEHLVETLANAPYRATEQVFQAALREEVDFVVLTGDLVDAASSGPRAVAFLRKHFELLHDNRIPVYWAASKLDLSSDWLQHVDLPANIHLFSDQLVESKTVIVNDCEAAAVFGRSWNVQRTLRASEYAAGPSDVPHIAVLYGSCELDDLPARIGFWAMGGASAAATRFVGKQVIHCPGWPQGILPTQTGAHGCTLVHVDAAGDIRTRNLETDVVRWVQERVVVPEGAALADVRNALRLRAHKLLADAERLVLIHWVLCGDGWFNSSLVHEHRRTELLQWLREEFGKGSPSAWSVSLDIEPPERLRDEWTDEDSILGDYLRIAREYLEDDARPLALSLPQTARELPAELREALMLNRPETRRNILREASLLGVGLLRGDDRSAELATLAGRMESET